MATVLKKSTGKFRTKQVFVFHRLSQTNNTLDPKSQFHLFRFLCILANLNFVRPSTAINFSPTTLHVLRQLDTMFAVPQYQSPWSVWHGHPLETMQLLTLFFISFCQLILTAEPLENTLTKAFCLYRSGPQVSFYVEPQKR